MKTPVYDFVDSYIQKNRVRAHMPGHKGISKGFSQGNSLERPLGKPLLGIEARDITEIDGGDVLCESAGILGESQRQAAKLFGAGATIYSTEGSSLAIKGMLYGALMKWKTEFAFHGSVLQMGQDTAGQTEPHRPVILAARNVHRAMIDGCGLLDIDVEFISSGAQQSICCALVTPEQVEEALEREASPMAVYITSPDYLGVQSDISGIAKVCHRHHVLLLVDNAHGGYLAFLRENQHPMALGADMCCDSAHKTLPVLTGGAYLHLSHRVSDELTDTVRRGIAMFGSTSPSYLILQSLDLCNAYLEDAFLGELRQCMGQIAQFKEALQEAGVPVVKGEPLKITIHTGGMGYSGEEISREMRGFIPRSPEAGKQGIECEYADSDFVVLMMTPCNEPEDWDTLYQWLDKTCLRKPKPPIPLPREERVSPLRKMTIRQAMLAPSETVPTWQAVGRVLAQETVSCPPAIPIVISGEEITKKAVEEFERYGIREVVVVY